MITKPPPGVPRSCWNIYDAKRKKQYNTLADAAEVAKQKHNYQGYHCRYCDKYHIGRLVKQSAAQYYNRRPELEIELGTRVVSHLRMGDTLETIKKRFRSAMDISYRYKNK